MPSSVISFFLGTSDLYVWTRDKDFEPKHNQDVVEEYFGDKCYGRGFCHRVIFAGVKTPYHDSNGEAIYTGDVLRVALGDINHSSENADEEFKRHGRVLAFGTLGENSNNWKARYAFCLDNHCITPDMVTRWERIGTVFYQLDWSEVPETIACRCDGFQDLFLQGPKLEDKLIMARYTPNFDQEIWKYHSLEILGVEEYNWRKR